ncbi:flagellar assembly protein FliX [Brevundimonas sp.]|uniref:flagellar assembly protein FliX n=1 Tax=Brevundimonas sp. TaxID=1871086 RepID=UPI001DF9F838|nr:flagellar assembly protein FliX [Brevundimonas sp.]MBA4001077.1 flagellar assembly regulator FliX [Brevundimonas sp.]
MKVTGPSGTTSTPSSRTSRTSGGGFSLPSGGASGPGAASAASAAGGVAGVSALMALQGVEDATERRRRAMRRGGGLLDRLDELKLMMLAGQDGVGVLNTLARAVREERPDCADPGLDAVLDQIDLRAAVELAKADMRRSL